LFISCRKLKDLDVFSKSDPQCRIYEFKEQQRAWMMIAKTETIKNNLNPDFKANITVGYAFEQAQKFKFEVIDDDGAGSFDLIGTVETTLGNIMGARQQTFSADLKIPTDRKARGRIIIRAEGLEASNTVVRMQISCD
jgi:Ca2+-dependent lipid-binding protein